MVTGDRRKSLPSVLQPGWPAPKPQSQGSSRAAGRARPPAASEASLATDFPLAAPMKKQGSKLRGMGTKVSLEERTLRCYKCQAQLRRQ